MSRSIDELLAEGRADDLLWNRVVRDHGDSECILCVSCFIARAEHYYDVTAWKLSIAPVLIERAVAPSPKEGT